MCGIVGIISNNPHYNDANFLAPMLFSTHHRGPDASTLELFPGAGCFGHNRLSIIDLNPRSKQPMWDATHRYCLSFNGEIYNHQEIKKELTHLKHYFRTESDSEVLIEAWAEWGVLTIDRFVGMFAFSVFDDQLKQLFLVRDRMGEKPLYYSPINQRFDNGLVFSSELKALLQYPFTVKNISMTALNHYLSFNYTSTCDAIFKDIYKLPAASYLQYDLNTCKYTMSEYWRLANFFQQKNKINFNDATEKLNHLLKNSVKQQSVSDVPLGAFLSGGIDSSSIVAAMRENNKEQINTFGIGFNEKTYSEIENSQKVANYLSVKHRSKIVEENFIDDISKIINVFDEPFADTSLIPMYCLSKYAREYVTVCLSGDGSDELFGGYTTYQADRYYQLMQYVPNAFKRQLSHVSEYFPTTFNKVSLDYKIKQFFRGCMLDAKHAHLSWREIFNPEKKNKLFRSDFRGFGEQDTEVLQFKWFDDVSDCHYLDQAMYVDMKTWLADDILVKVDRTSMAHSLEVRAPFLDHRLVEFAVGLPVGYKIKARNGKRILKQSQKNKLPRVIINQAKKGFSSPMSIWLTGNFFKMAHDITTSQCLQKWFDKAAIEKLWLEHQKGLCDNGYRIFNLLCLGVWCQKYLY